MLPMVPVTYAKNDKDLRTAAWWGPTPGRFMRRRKYNVRMRMRIEKEVLLTRGTGDNGRREVLGV